MNEKRPYGQSVRPFFIPWRWRDHNLYYHTVSNNIICAHVQYIRVFLNSQQISCNII
nr:MAG TPA: hypothetical protein [Bacteriophage sp.]